MRPVATDVTRSMVCVCVSVRVVVTRICCEKTAELIELPFGERTHVGLKNHMLNWVEIPTERGNFVGCLAK